MKYLVDAKHIRRIISGKTINFADVKAIECEEGWYQELIIHFIDGTTFIVSRHKAHSRILRYVYNDRLDDYMVQEYEEEEE